ncbi:Hypothetical predicted protein, partial [Paramuricea clavata]
MPNTKKEHADNWHKKAKISMEHPCQMRSIYQLCNVRGKKLLEMFLQNSKAIRKSDGSFTSQRLQLESGVSQVSNRTFR